MDLGPTGNEPLVIKTNNSERMRITADGKIGIGTADPPRRLQIGADGSGIGFDPADASPNAGYIRFGDNTGWKLHFGRSREKAGSVGGTINTGMTGVLMTIQDNGNVGIGTADPPRRLQIGADGSGIGFDPADASPNAGYIRFGDNTGWKLHFGRSREKAGSVGGTINTGMTGVLMTIQDNGNVGIGTADPPRQLQIGGDVAGIGFDAADASPNAGYIRFGDNTGWKLHFGRSRESAGGAINTGTTGLLMTIQDDGSITIPGDIVLANADCAEEFDIEESAEVEPGTVMVLGHDGVLRQSASAYDKHVAGVISGGGDYKPGLILDKQQVQPNRKPVALVGKVYCKVDAQYAPIEVGDLLTTSPTPGHAMKADDPLRIPGSVIGKALRGLQSGQGLVPILVALQ